MKLPRRRFLQAAGISLALPWLDVFSHGQAQAAQPKRRMICLCTPLGLHPADFFPERTGRNYQLTPYLDVLRDFRDDFTVVSGLAHAGMSPGFAHQASASMLTGAPGAGRPGTRNSISLDQFAAEHIAGRLGYLVEPIRDNRGVLVGREFRFATRLRAVQFKLLVDTTLAGRPLSSTGVTK